MVLVTMLVVGMGVALAVSLLAAWQTGRAVSGRQVAASAVLVAAMTLRVCERILSGTL